jgi:hypothetical protein
MVERLKNLVVEWEKRVMTLEIEKVGLENDKVTLQQTIGVLESLRQEQRSTMDTQRTIIEQLESEKDPTTASEQLLF